MNYFGKIKILLAMLIVLLYTLLGAGCSDGGIDGTGEEPIEGTAAVGAPIKNATITIKSNTGKKRTGTSDEFGKFNIKVPKNDGPYLLRINTDDSKVIYSVAKSPGRANIHPLSDLIIRNWYKVQNSNVETEFDSETALTKAPSETEIDVLKAVIREIFKILFAEFNVPDDFDIIESLFEANGSDPFDQLLDHLSISFKDGKIKIKIKHDETKIETEITDGELDDTDDLTQIDTTAPVLANAPTSNVLAVAASPSKIIVVWDAATDNIAVTGYNVFRDDGQTFTTPYPVFVDVNALVASTPYCYQIQAFDGTVDEAGNPVNKSAITTIDANACATTLDAADTDPPVAPINLIATANNTSGIDLTWTKSVSTDVIGYHIYRGATGAVDTKITTIIGNTYTDAGLLPATNYCYTIAAFDAAGNPSVASLEGCATTPGDAAPPPAPIVNPISTLTKEAQITVSGTSEATSTVTVLGGSSTISTTTSITGTFTVVVPLTLDASNTLSLQAMDSSGNQSISVNIDSNSNPLIITQDSTPPEILMTTPSSGAFDIPIDTTITVTFTEEIDSTTVTTNNFSVLQNSSAISGVLSTSGSEVIFTPDPSLDFLTSYDIQVNVNGIQDLAGNSITSGLSITFTTIAENISNNTPTANAGIRRLIVTGGTITLNGNASSDPNNDVLTYSWTLTTPNGSNASLSIPTSPTPSFTADLAGDYIAQLTVSDGLLNSSPDTVTITARDLSPSLNCGTLVTASIDLAGEVDLFSFSGTTGDIITTTLSWLTGPSGANPRAIVRAPSGTQILDFLGTGQRNLTLPETGKYTIQLQANNLVSSISYALSLECLSPLGPIDVMLKNGDLISASIASPAQVNYYTFTAEKDDIKTLTLSWITGASGTNPHAIVFAPSGTEVLNFLGTMQKIVTLPESGEYTIQLDSNNLIGAITYTIGLESLSPAEVVNNTLSDGEIINGTIDLPAQIDLYTFSGVTGHKKALTLSWLTGASGTNPHAIVYAPDGTEILNFLGTAQQIITLPSTGEYLIQLQSYNLIGAITYNLGMDSISPVAPINATLLDGGIINGSIISPAQVDLYTFSGIIGDKKALTLSWLTGASGTNPHAIVYAPDGTEILNFLGTAQQIITLPSTGEYLIQLQSYNLIGAITYVIGLEKLLPLGQVDSTITCGNVTGGETITAAQVNLYSFDATIGDSVTITLSWLTGASGTNPRAIVYSPTGTEIANFLGTGQQILSILDTGTYAIQLQSENYIGSITYNIGLSCI